MEAAAAAVVAASRDSAGPVASQPAVASSAAVATYDTASAAGQDSYPACYSTDSAAAAVPGASAVDYSLGRRAFVVRTRQPA